MDLEKELEEKRALLKEKGIVLTTPRLIILEYLLEHRIHPTAEEIYQALKKRFPSLSLASIYNTLKLFTQLGIVVEFAIDKDKARYDINTNPHAHFKCLHCGQIYDLFNIPLPNYEELEGHKILMAQLYFYGICQRCLKER
ncbi:MAG TPA: transcriptional repressor [Candidatus Desulfofervidus auxilii]|uniref:Ferric uptake regulation protein n=1 Tax=Desulfofervidus auxilii TaxID=1621989 RepID=A0A7C0U1R4_DESA2|nr:transcriptional repressor [Candidatus Desulfofervidus auxilii]